MDRWATFIKGGKCALGAGRAALSSLTTCVPPQLPPVLSLVNQGWGGGGAWHGWNEHLVCWGGGELLDAKICGWYHNEKKKKQCGNLILPSLEGICQNLSLLMAQMKIQLAKLWLSNPYGIIQLDGGRGVIKMLQQQGFLSRHLQKT